jgi:HD superfamily phosphodiesterase
MDILNDARLHLVDFLKGKQNGFKTRHPWRKGWEFTAMHCLRVEAYTLKILARENHPLSENEITRLRLAAILHDLAKLEQTDDHARLGAELAGQWLQGYAGNPLTGEETGRVVEMIAEHSNKAVREQDFSKAVLKDADLLDEIGVMSIFMSSNWLDNKTPFFFHDLHQRLADFEIPFCDRTLATLNTEGARKLLEEKKAFIETFIAQLGNELQADELIAKMRKEP